MTVIVRAETASDFGAIRAVHESAFPTSQEADLVDALRVDGDLVLSLVAIKDGEIAGHIAFSRLMVKSETGSFPAIALAPIAVKPRFQRAGIGGVLIENGLPQLAKSGETLVFVLGDPDYYGRFGFDAGPAAGFASQYPAPYFQLKRLAHHAPKSGFVHYASAFSGLA